MKVRTAKPKAERLRTWEGAKVRTAKPEDGQLGKWELETSVNLMMLLGNRTYRFSFPLSSTLQGLFHTLDPTA